jgi:hypothetical protein
VNGLGVLEALSDQFNVSLRRRNPARRFLLKGVQDVQDALKAHGVDSSIRIAVEAIANFEDAAKTLERFRVMRMIPKLCFKRACPISPRTAAGNACRSLRLEPTKIAGSSERKRSIIAL